jgi:hypothetical protein
MDAVTPRLTPADAPRIGEYWKGQGGIYAGIMPDYVGTQPRFLVFATDESIDQSWGGFASAEPGARDPYNGAGNTHSLVSCARRPHQHDAAHFADEYEKDGHQDFYLPSKRELDLAFHTIPETFDPKEWYWSSTEESKVMAYGRTSVEAELPSLFKHMSGRARPVRSFPVANETPQEP